MVGDLRERRGAARPASSGLRTGPHYEGGRIVGDPPKSPADGGRRHGSLSLKRGTLGLPTEMSDMELAIRQAQPSNDDLPAIHYPRLPWAELNGESGVRYRMLEDCNRSCLLWPHGRRLPSTRIRKIGVWVSRLATRTSGRLTGSQCA